MVLVGHPRVLHKAEIINNGGAKERPVMVLYTSVDFGIKDAAFLGLAQQEALDALSDWLVVYVLLNGKVIGGWYHALIEAEQLVEAVIAVKERKHCQAWVSLCRSCRTCQWPCLSDRQEAESPRGCKAPLTSPETRKA